MPLQVKQTDRENLNAHAAKTLHPATKPLLNTRRLALGEVGNKLHSNTGQNGVQSKTFKVTQADNKKKPAGEAIKKVTSVHSVAGQNKPVKAQSFDKVNLKHTTKPTTDPSSVITAGQNKLVKAQSFDKANLKQTTKTTTDLPASTTAGQNKLVKAQSPDKVNLKQTTKSTSDPAALPSAPESASYSTKQLSEIIDIDTSDNPLQVSEYVQDIYKYLLELEDKYIIEKNFLADHKSTPRMRAVLIDWMVDIHINFKFLLETLHLSVAILDRYLQKNKGIGRSTLQLVGTVAMFIAGKYEEMYLPSISDFVYICDNTFSQKQLLEMELDILNQLEFNLGRPLSLQFLRRFNKIASVQSYHHTLGKYLLELALIDYELCQIKPSLQAAAACCLSISILNDISTPSKVWTKTLVHHTTYVYSDLKPVILSMVCVLSKAETSKHQCIRNKYASSSYGKISAHPKLKGLVMKTLLSQATSCNQK